jgi:hypothetical protein
VLCTVVEWIGLSSAPHDIGRGHLRRFHPRRTWVSGNEPLVHARTPTPTPTHPPTHTHTHTTRWILLASVLSQASKVPRIPFRSAPAAHASGEHTVSNSFPSTASLQTSPPSNSAKELPSGPSPNPSSLLCGLLPLRPSVPARTLTRAYTHTWAARQPGGPEGRHVQGLKAEQVRRAAARGQLPCYHSRHVLHRLRRHARLPKHPSLRFPRPCYLHGLPPPLERGAGGGHVRATFACARRLRV